MKVINLKLVKYVLITILFIACSNDGNSKDNFPPIIPDQVFSIAENPSSNMSIGTIVANDDNNDNLSFRINTISNNDFRDAIEINISTGEIRVMDVNFFDFETITSFVGSVTVSDGEFEVNANITININNVEDGPLRNIEKEFIEEYEYLVANFSATSSGSLLNQKWNEGIRVFLDGSVTNQFRDVVNEVITEFNELFTNGVDITLVDSLAESNIHVVMGSKTLIQNIWPDVFTSVCQGGFTGFATAFSDIGLNIFSANIWVDDGTSIGLFRHELGHVIGFRS